MKDHEIAPASKRPSHCHPVPLLSPARSGRLHVRRAARCALEVDITAAQRSHQLRRRFRSPRRDARRSGAAGIHHRKVKRLRSAIELTRLASASARPEGSDSPAPPTSGPTRARLQSLAVEEFWAIALDVRHRVLFDEMLARESHRRRGPPRDVFRPLIRAGAAAVLFCHNHPSGDPTPSRQDIGLPTGCARSATCAASRSWTTSSSAGKATRASPSGGGADVRLRARPRQLRRPPPGSSPDRVEIRLELLSSHE